MNLRVTITFDPVFMTDLASLASSAAALSNAAAASAAALTKIAAEIVPTPPVPGPATHAEIELGKPQ
jgi:hypothetical protein